MILIPKIFNSSKIIAAQSTRLGGVSPAPFSSLNLGLSVNDNKENVMRNRELFFGRLGIELSQLSKGHQVHGNKVIVVDAPGNHEGYDAQITNKRNVFLVVSIADCTPILVHDAKNDVVAAVHAGWRGTAGKIVENVLRTMHENFGTEGKFCKAFIGACISYPNFEVAEEVASNFNKEVKRFDSEKQKWLVDLKSENKNQLMRFGVLPENIEISDYCTVRDNATFFSHRKENRTTGRMMAVIGLHNLSLNPSP